MMIVKVLRGIQRLTVSQGTYKIDRQSKEIHANHISLASPHAIGMAFVAIWNTMSRRCTAVISVMISHFSPGTPVSPLPRKANLDPYDRLHDALWEMTATTSFPSLEHPIARWERLPLVSPTASESRTSFQPDVRPASSFISLPWLERH